MLKSIPFLILCLKRFCVDTNDSCDGDGDGDWVLNIDVDFDAAIIECWIFNSGLRKVEKASQGCDGVC